MKKVCSYHFLCILTLLVFSACQKKSGGTWDDKVSSKMKDGGNGLWGEELMGADKGLFALEEDFIPLQEEDLKAQFADGAIPQPKYSPGETGSGLPGIEHFRTPDAELAHLFRSLYFNTDDHILRGKEYMHAVDTMAAYLKAHPNTFLCIAGHCDERAPEAYNLSLGARRANYVRTLLIQKGVNIDQIYTISYGKERPAAFGHTAQDWAKNRRAEFRIYKKS